MATGPAVRCHDGTVCGVFGVHAPGQPVAHLVYLGLYALQHRGQESAGLAVSDTETLTVVKDMGLVSHVLDGRLLAALDGDLAIGHTRYSTAGASSWRASQPFYRDVGDLEFAVVHNGTLVNVDALASDAGMLAGTVTSDTDLIAELVAAELHRDLPVGRELETAVALVAPRLRGGFTLVFQDRSTLVGIRDPRGLWPLCLGRLESGGWVLASETPALETAGAHVVRHVEPGEMVVIDAGGCRSVRPFDQADVQPNLCLFEFVYFSRPDSTLYGQNLHQARQRMGEQLAEQAPVEADMVMPVPESGIPAAQGYARRSGIPYQDGLVKNRYIGRTFIAPSQQLRDLGVRMKLNPIRAAIEGRRLVVVDDSIVRGTTTRAIVQMLREAGASEVHLRVSSPPYRWPCHYGIDTGARSELLAADLTVEEIRAWLGVDTLAYLGLDRLVQATGAAGAGFCDACLTGDYPVEVPVDLQVATLGDGGKRLDDGADGPEALALQLDG